MSRYLFDLESDGLLDELTKIHCIVCKDLDSGRVFTFHESTTISPRDSGLTSAVNMLEVADLIVGANITKFDIPAIQKLYPWFNPKGTIRDTLVMSRLIWPNMMELDSKAKVKDFPKQLTGRHSLEAWGWRLGCHKGDYKGGWETFSQEMLDYCVQDIEVTHKLYEKILSKNYSEEAIQLEHDFAYVMFLMEQHGFAFDEKKAHELHARLGQRRLELERELQVIFPGWTEDMKQPENWRAYFGDDPTKGWHAPTKSALVTLIKPKVKALGRKMNEIILKPGSLKTKHTSFNPGSRDHVARVFVEKYGWKPKQYTDGGKPQIDESVLEQMVFPEAKSLLEYFMIEKRLGMLAEGDNGWLKLVKKGRIHGQINPMGTVTSRCSHSKPNMGQVTAVDKPYGKESRSLFIPNPGHVLVGADASGIQLRALAHYLHRWDGGEYVKLVTTGDVHTANQKAAGLPTRDMAKTFIYSWLLGAGAAKTGQIIGKGAKEGRELQDRFLKNLPAFKHLKDRIAQRVAESGSITGLDGRICPVGSAHLALGSLLQSFEAIVLKKATWFLYSSLLSKGFQHGTHFGFCAMVHDEWQISAQKEIADVVGTTAVESITRAGEYFKCLCPLTGEYKIGGDWAGTH
jgi:DNA polymerase I-like protein with 3'-5' exonuclease and polymerase domains